MNKSEFIFTMIASIGAFILSLFYMPAKWAFFIALLIFLFFFVFTSRDVTEHFENLRNREEMYQEEKIRGRAFEEGRMSARNSRTEHTPIGSSLFGVKRDPNYNKRLKRIRP